MAEVIKQWLKSRIDPLVSVQTTYTNPTQADLVIQTWSGVRVRVHLVNEPLRTRMIKHILQDATSVGVSTIFLLDARLFPADGERFVLKEWLQGIQMLTSGYVYAYRVVDRQLQVFQAHFEQVKPTSYEHKVWYGPQVPFARLRHYRTSIKLRFLKGDWLVADFDTPPFWRNSDYRTYRTQRDNIYNSQRPTRWETWSAYRQTWKGNNDGPIASPTSPLRAYLQECYTLLGVDESASQEEVKRAFRKQAISVHPDTSELPHDAAEDKFRALSNAYEYIKSARGWT